MGRYVVEGNYLDVLDAINSPTRGIVQLVDDTCKNIRPKRYTKRFVCSSCKYDTALARVYGEGVDNFKRCPNCGSKVME